MLLFASCGKDYGSPVVTAGATDVTMNSATLNGYVDTEYLIMGGEIGFIVSTSSTPTFDNGQKFVPSDVGNNGKYSIQLSYLASSTTYYYKAFLNTGTTNLVGDVKKFTTKDFVYVAVDLGLSVKWANANLGATALEDNGDYYAWGETQTKSEYSWDTYKWYNNHQLTKYNTKSEYGTVDNKTVLDPEDDVVHVKLGGKWRMPTGPEMAELVSTWDNSSYKWEWESINGHNGYMVTYLINNNSIFLPAAGYRYDSFLFAEGGICCSWSSSLNTNYPPYAGGMHWSNTYSPLEPIRSLGFPVRPVLE